MNGRGYDNSIGTFQGMSPGTLDSRIVTDRGKVDAAGAHSIRRATVLITGGTGSFGRTMLHDLLAKGCPEVRVLSRDEEKQDTLRNSLRKSNVRFYIGDVRDRDSVDRAMRGVTHVFHAAALKQVPSCEFFPLEAVRTNILGSENVVRSAAAAGVRSVVCLSTDKAVFPINAMGISKAMMEKLAGAIARSIGPEAATTVSLVRYGNVMCSRGSVIPLFIRQIKSGQPITITEPAMTRFLMPLRDSVALVHYAFENARQGDLFIRKAPASTVADLVIALKELFGRPDHSVEVVGWRHGEKLFETLASAQELTQSEDMGDYFRISMDGRDLNYRAYFSEGDVEVVNQSDYHSHNTERLDVAGVKALLLTLPEVVAEIKSAACQ
jgi:UDP-N-acetylglucosamine 4,6-dehydratase